MWTIPFAWLAPLIAQPARACKAGLNATSDDCPAAGHQTFPWEPEQGIASSLDPMVHLRSCFQLAEAGGQIACTVSVGFGL